VSTENGKRPAEAYEPPRIEILGAVEDVTRGGVGTGGDFEAHASATPL
jgi:hypothetical protein